MFVSDKNVKFSAKKARFLQSDFNFSLKTLFETNSLKKPKESRYSKLEGHSKLRLCNPPPLSHSAVLRGVKYIFERKYIYLTHYHHENKKRAFLEEYCNTPPLTP